MRSGEELISDEAEELFRNLEDSSLEELSRRQNITQEVICKVIAQFFYGRQYSIVEGGHILNERMNKETLLFQLRKRRRIFDHSEEALNLFQESSIRKKENRENIAAILGILGFLGSFIWLISSYVNPSDPIQKQSSLSSIITECTIVGLFLIISGLVYKFSSEIQLSREIIEQINRQSPFDILPQYFRDNYCTIQHIRRQLRYKNFSLLPYAAEDLNKVQQNIKNQIKLQKDITQKFTLEALNELISYEIQFRKQDFKSTVQDQIKKFKRDIWWTNFNLTLVAAAYAGTIVDSIIKIANKYSMTAASIVLSGTTILLLLYIILKRKELARIYCSCCQCCKDKKYQKPKSQRILEERN